MNFATNHILRKNVRQITYLREVVLGANNKHITYLREFVVRTDKIRWGLVKVPVTPKSQPSSPYKRYEDETINPRPVAKIQNDITKHHKSVPEPILDDDDWDIDVIRRNGGL